MHLILAFVSAIVSIFYILDRLGIDIGGINPFAWRRRRAWAKRYQGDPVYALDDPMDVAAVLVIGTSRITGDLSIEQKQTAIRLFQETFSIDAQAATALYASSSHLLAAPQLIESQLDGLLGRSEDRFSDSQAISVLAMIDQVLDKGLAPGSDQLALVGRIRAAIARADALNNQWT